MPKGGGVFSPMARQQQQAAVLSPAAPASTRPPGSGRQGMLLVAEHAERRVQAEREVRRQLAVDHRQQLRAQISHREAAARAEQQRIHAAERTAIPATSRPWDSRFECKQLDPAPWAQHTEPERAHRRDADLKRVLVGEGELVDADDAVWDTAQGIWRRGGSPQGLQRGNRAGFDAIADVPEGWTAADQQRLADERAVRAAEMDSKWDDGMSNISDALSELLDSLTIEAMEPGAVETEDNMASSKTVPVVLVSRQGLGGQHSKGKKVVADARGNTQGLLYHRDAGCPVPAPVEKNIAIYAKLIKGGGVITRGTASFMGVRQLSGKVNAHDEHVIQPILISGPDNRILPKGYSGARRSGSAGLPPPLPKKPPLPSVKIKKSKKNTASIADPAAGRVRNPKPSIPKQVGAPKKKRDEVTPEESGVDAGVTPAQLAQLAAMTVVDIGESDSDESQPTPAGSSSEEDTVEQPTEEEEDPAAKASRLHTKNLQRKMDHQQRIQAAEQQQQQQQQTAEKLSSTPSGVSKDSGDDPVFAQLMSMVAVGSIPAASFSSDDGARDDDSVEAKLDARVSLPEAVPPPNITKPPRPPPKRPPPKKPPSGVANRTVADESVSNAALPDQVVEERSQHQGSTVEDGGEREEEKEEKLQQEQKEPDAEEMDADAGLTVAVPDGSAGGETITIALEDGREMDIQIPDGLVAGDEFAITIEDDEHDEQEQQEEQDQEEQEEQGEDEPNEQERKDFSTLRVVDLRARLADLELPTDGRKADLVQRLDEHYDDAEEQQQQHEEQQQEVVAEAVNEEDDFVDELTASLSPSRRTNMGNLYLQQEQEEGDEDDQDDQDDVEDAAVDGGLTVVVPEGSAGGETITIALEDGREMDIQIPDGLVAGDEFAITIEDDDEQEQQDQEEQDQEDQEEYDAREDGQDGFVALTIVCPMGSVPGDSVSIQTDSGEVDVLVPTGVAEGDEFEVHVPLDGVAQTSPDPEREAVATAAEQPQPTSSLADSLASIMASVEDSSDDESASASSGDIDLEALLDILDWQRAADEARRRAQESTKS